MQGWPHHILTKQSIIVVVGVGGGEDAGRRRLFWNFKSQYYFQYDTTKKLINLSIKYTR